MLRNQNPISLIEIYDLLIYSLLGPPQMWPNIKINSVKKYPNVMIINQKPNNKNKEALIPCTEINNGYLIFFF